MTMIKHKPIACNQQILKLLSVIFLEGVNKPPRVRHSFTQSINGTPGQVFPLLCPVREVDWIPGWTTDWVISQSGVAEQNCIFQTPPRPGAGVASKWVITRHDAIEHDKMPH